MSERDGVPDSVVHQLKTDMNDIAYKALITWASLDWPLSEMQKAEQLAAFRANELARGCLTAENAASFVRDVSTTMPPELVQILTSFGHLPSPIELAGLDADAAAMKDQIDTITACITEVRSAWAFSQGGALSPGQDSHPSPGDSAETP
eukprot:2342080-Karenia_brevis.AAC.1